MQCEFSCTRQHSQLEANESNKFDIYADFSPVVNNIEGNPAKPQAEQKQLLVNLISYLSLTGEGT